MWIGDTYPEELLPYSAKDVHPGFVFIGSTNLIGADNFIKAEEYAESMQAENPRIARIWKHLGFVNKANLIRFHYLSKNKNTLYLDCDARLVEHPEYRGRPMFGKCAWGLKMRDIFIIYNGEDTEMFSNLIEQGLDISETKAILERGWFYSTLNRYFRKTSDLISRECFDHLGYTGRALNTIQQAYWKKEYDPNAQD